MEDNFVAETISADRRKLFGGGIALGVIGIVFGVLFPAVTYGCSIPGLVLTMKKSRKGYRTNASLVLNIVAIAVAFANSVLAVLVTAGGFFKKRTGEF